jgi:alpha-1,2-mannosyltransferase
LTTAAPGPKKIPFANWAVVAVCCAMWTFLGAMVTPSSRNHDFLNIYTGASLALQGRFAELHDINVQLEEERKYVPQADRLVPFVRPHFYALILAPLALLPFGIAFWTWLGLQTLVLFACWHWAVRRFPPDSLVISALYLPTALGIAHGQDGVLMLAISIGAWSLLESGKPLQAGLVLALGLIKFHLFFLWPFAMLLARDWRMLGGFAAGGAAEALLSLLLGGFSGAQHYIAMLTNKDLERLSPTPEFMINAQSIAANFANGNPVVQAGWTLLVAALWIWSAWKAPLWRWWASTAFAGLLIVPHTYGYDASLLLLPFWLALFVNTDKTLRIVATLASTPIPFLMTLADKPWSGAAALALTLVLAAMARTRSQSVVTAR